MNINKKRKPTFFIVLAFTLLLAYCAFIGLTIPFGIYNFHLRDASDIRFGIDISGGVDAVYEPVGLDRSPTADEMDAARTIIETRMDQHNILDREVTVDNTNGTIIVRFPWQAGESTFDPEQALSELGETAKLTFQDDAGNVILEGKHVEKSAPMYNQQTGEYYVDLQFDDEGAKLFGDATKEMVGQNIYIYMDETLVETATVEEYIPGGQASIDKLKDMETAAALSEKINAGALPFSMATKNNSIITPTLGSEALNIMVTAGIIALVVICCLLVAFYRMSGVVAVIALLMQVSGEILILSYAQVTVTLTGIAGIILSIGMGVDANVIISERVNEEIRGGKTVRAAIESGFKGAWSSVFDGNITVLIVAVVMMCLGSGSLLSFAYTLIIGIAFNFIAGVGASRLMLRSLCAYAFFNKPGLFTCWSGRVTYEKE